MATPGRGTERRSHPDAVVTLRQRTVPEDPENVDAAVEAALRVLRGAAQTEASLRRRLEFKGWSPAAARAATAAMTQHGYVDDDAFAQSVAARRLRGGYGRARVASELRARGVAERPIDDVLRTVGMDDERVSAGRVAERLLERDRTRHGPDDPRTAERVAGALARRGYDVQTIRHALRTAWGEAPEFG